MGSECPSVYGIANSDGAVHTHWDSYRIISSEMGGVSSTYKRGEERCIHDCYMKERDNLEDVCEDGRVILIWTLKTGW